MRTIIHISRLVVGNLFVFSGLVKLNDPLGFSYKLEEYFIEFGMNWEWLHSILIPLAAALCIAEIVLGIAVLVGYKMKQTSWLLLLMIVFFTILTFASAVFEIVRSCGCFGDAIPLTPWESFMKDIILLVLILFLFLNRNRIVSFPDRNFDLIYFVISAINMFLLSYMLEWYMPLYLMLIILGVNLALKFSRKRNFAAPSSTWISAALSLFIGIYAIENLPFKDFRPYAVGKSLPDQMVLPPGAQEPVYENILTYENKKTGEEKEFTSAEFTESKIWEDTDWEWKSTDNKLIVEGDLPKITDFSIVSHSGSDMTGIFLEMERLIIIVSNDLSATEESVWDDLKKLVVDGTKHDIVTIVLSPATWEEVQAFVEKHDLPMQIYITDGIVLKTIVRSNPGIVYLEKGTVMGKWHYNNLPTINQLK